MFFRSTLRVKAEAGSGGNVVGKSNTDERDFFTFVQTN